MISIFIPGLNLRRIFKHSWASIVKSITLPAFHKRFISEQTKSKKLRSQTLFLTMISVLVWKPKTSLKITIVKVFLTMEFFNELTKTLFLMNKKVAQSCSALKKSSARKVQALSNQITIKEFFTICRIFIRKRYH